MEKNCHFASVYFFVLTFFLNLTIFLRSEVFDISSLKTAPQIKKKLERVNLHTLLLCIRIFIYHDWTLFVFNWSHMIFQMLLQSDILWRSIYFTIEWSALKYCYKCAVSSLFNIKCSVSHCFAIIYLIIIVVMVIIMLQVL